jgi:hypothetical protein
VVLVGVVAVRFWWLDLFPPGFNHDEADVVMSAVTFARSGSDSSGVKLPDALFASKTEAWITGWTSFMLVPVVSWWGVGMGQIRVWFGIMNLLTGVMVAGTLTKLTRNKILGWAIMAVWVVSPWMLAMARATTEAPVGLWWWVVGWWWLMTNTGRRIWVAVVPWGLAWLTYIGMKPVLMVGVPILLIWHKIWMAGRTRGRDYLLVVVLVGVVFGVSGGIGYVWPGSILRQRSQSEVVWTEVKRYGEIVGERRKNSIVNPWENVVVNKLWVGGGEMAKKYLGIWGQDFLLWGGDARATYRFFEYGAMHMWDVVLIAVGVWVVARDLRWMGYGVGMVLFGQVGSVVSSVETSYFFRAGVFGVGLVILLGIGLARVGKWAGVVYVLMGLSFGHFFLMRYPVIAQENQFLGERIMVNYLHRESGEVWVVTPEPQRPQTLFKLYFGLTELPGRIRWIKNCDEVDYDKLVVMDVNSGCRKGTSGVRIVNQKDAGELWWIGNSKLCDKSELALWRRFNLISDYAVEEMDDTSFCRRWINL